MAEVPTQILLENARHKSVTEKRLTELKGGLTARYLYDNPLFEYLDGDEQPHFILAARKTAPTFKGRNPPTWSGQSLQGMAMHMITDLRWVMVCGIKGGDGVHSIPIEEIAVTDYSTGHSGHEINLRTPDHEIKIPIGNMYDSDEVEDLVEYLKGINGKSEEEIRNQEGDTQPTAADTGADEPPRPDGAIMMAEGANGQVTLFENKIRISREDLGILHKLNQLGKGEKEIRLDDITSVQLKKPTLSKGYIQFGQSGYSESDDGAFDAVDDENSVMFTQERTDEFVQLRDEIEKLRQQDNTTNAGSDVDPTEQLKNIKELHDSGVLSDEEFEEKREDLLDKI